MNVSRRLREDADPVWQKIFRHPFVVELYEGRLPLEKFVLYILQDYHYLVDAIKNFCLIASRAETADQRRRVLEIAHLEAVSELQSYEQFLTKLGYTVVEAAAVEPIPANLSYRSFLLATSCLKPFPESLTAALPCFWTYAAIAEHHRTRLGENPQPLYREWASVYGTDEYQQLVVRLTALVDEVTRTYPYGPLREMFVTASRYEYLYWDAVYGQESWPA
ncbi:MAG: TenA family protein [Acidobacteria bacterium]|nr:TenA family protein [Acidobacteriota bacterium]